MTKPMVLANGVMLLLACGLQACCFGSGDANGNGSAAAVPAANPAGSPGIVGWGPRHTTAGTPFNVQPNGQAAIWIRMDRPLQGWVAKIRFDDAVLEGHVSGDVVTAVVPEALYATPGVYRVRVAARKDGALRLSNEVSFTVR